MVELVKNSEIKSPRLWRGSHSLIGNILKFKKKIKSTKQKSFTVSQNPKFPAHIFLRHSPQLTGNAHEYWIDGQTPTLIGYGISCFSANVNRLYSIPQLSIQVFLFTNQWTKLETVLSCSVKLCLSKCDVQ